MSLFSKDLLISNLFKMSKVTKIYEIMILTKVSKNNRNFQRPDNHRMIAKENNNI